MPSNGEKFYLFCYVTYVKLSNPFLETVGDFINVFIKKRAQNYSSPEMFLVVLFNNTQYCPIKCKFLPTFQTFTQKNSKNLYFDIPIKYTLANMNKFLRCCPLAIVIEK